MEENVKLMSVLKIGLELQSKVMVGVGCCGLELNITSPLAGGVGGKIGGEWSMWVKVTSASCPAISQPLPHKPSAQGSWGPFLESSGLPRGTDLCRSQLYRAQWIVSDTLSQL